MEPRMRASPEQFGILIEFMERCGDLSKPQSGPQGRIKSERLWAELCTLLNSVGGGVQKSTDKWKKVWADWKTKTKRKYLGIRQHADATGGGPSSRSFLTALEERVVAIIGVSAVVGQAGIEEQGFNHPTESSQQLIEVVHVDQNNLPPAQSPIPPPPSEDIQEAVPTQCTPPPLREQPDEREEIESPRAYRSPRRSLLRARRNRGLTPFDRAASEFVAIERSRLRFEEERDRRLHEREMERLQIERERLGLDAERIKVAQEHNNLLHQLSIIGQNVLGVLSRQQ